MQTKDFQLHSKFFQYWKVLIIKTQQFDVIKIRLNQYNGNIEFYSFGNIGWFNWERHGEEYYDLVDLVCTAKILMNKEQYPGCSFGGWDGRFRGEKVNE